MRIKEARRAHRQTHGGEVEASQCLAEHQRAPRGVSQTTDGQRLYLTASEVGHFVYCFVPMATGLSRAVSKE
jgi:hypothetical protein